MSIFYQAVGWNKQKKWIDLILVLAITLYIGLFIAAGSLFHPNATIETLLIRSTSTAAYILLHIILAIGPLARLNPKWNPFLYNRRHLGVTMFLLALVHSILVIIQYHSLGVLNPIVSIFVSNTEVTSISQFPFQPLGLAALAILFIMAATSHDFWLANLTAPVWKALHMLVYVAYALIIAHVGLGILQSETSPIYVLLVASGAASLVILHYKAAKKEKKIDTELSADTTGWVRACKPEDIRENRAKIVTISGERVAIFKYDGKLSAVSNVCQHQNGPLGEGKIIDGCITCPWHGYQYLPDSGQSPPPFHEKIPTFNLKLKDGWIWVDATPNLPGAQVEPLSLNQKKREEDDK